MNPNEPKAPPSALPRAASRGAPMLPFYLLATAIVIAAGVLSYRQTTERLPLDVHSQARATLPPRPAAEPTSAATPGPFKGSGPWVLAALPGCFEQTQRVDGPKDFVHARLPSDARPLSDGASLSAAACTLSDDKGVIVVTRGGDRFVLSAAVALYRSGDGLVTYRENGQLAELRMYRILK